MEKSSRKKSRPDCNNLADEVRIEVGEKLDDDRRGRDYPPPGERKS